MITLYVRRPNVAYVARHIQMMAAKAPFLAPNSALHFAATCRGAWRYLDAVRQEDITQNTDDQLELAGVETAVRNLSIAYARFASLATGNLRFFLTEQASDSQDLLLAFDPDMSFSDIEASTIAMITGASIQ